MLYEIGQGGLKKIDTPENHAKNNLPIGQVLHLNGYNEPDYIIVKNLGINERFSGYGAQYLTVCLEGLQQNRKNAYELKYISEKQDDRIAVYIMDEVKDAEFVLDLWAKSEAKRLRLQTEQDKLKAENDDLEAKGKELYKKHIPENAKALIVACYDVNDSDSQADYFAHLTRGLVILGYSTHKRDMFPEMRKHAAKIPETAHLAARKDELEHREKWSMGDGYYLKDGSRHTTGWRIEKKSYNMQSKEVYISLAERCIF